MDIDMQTARKYMSEPPVIDPESGYTLNYPIGLQVGPGPEREALVEHFARKRESAGIHVADDLLSDLHDPDAGRSTWDFFDEDAY